MIVKYVRSQDGTPYGCVVALWDEEFQRVVIGGALHCESKQVKVNEKSLRNVQSIVKKDPTKNITRRVNVPWSRDRIRQIAIGRAYCYGRFDKKDRPKNFPRITRSVGHVKWNEFWDAVKEVRERSQKYFKQLASEEITM